MAPRELPNDVVPEILLRLPVKSLMRLKCSCKGWCALIESPSFIDRHFRHENNQERLLVRHCNPNNEYAYALYLDDSLSGYEEPGHLQMPSTIDEILGPLNGIFCMVKSGWPVALLNPATRQFSPLPLPVIGIPQGFTAHRGVLGFGIDPSTGNFKLVSVWFFWNHEETEDQYYPSHVFVYNSGTDTYRHFQDVDYSTRFTFKSLCNTYLNGVYYWLAGYDETRFSILAFDMTSEKFREIQVSESIGSKRCYLGCYDGSIALLQYDVNKIDKFVDVWVMKDEGCWVKTFTVGPFQGIRWPLGFWSNTELLLENENPDLHLYKYNLNTRDLRAVESRRKGNAFFIRWVFSYKESLVRLIKREGLVRLIKRERCCRCKCGSGDASSDLVKDI